LLYLPNAFVDDDDNDNVDGEQQRKLPNNDDGGGMWRQTGKSVLFAIDDAVSRVCLT
jgi:hypothetical protein